PDRLVFQKRVWSARLVSFFDLKYFVDPFTCSSPNSFRPACNVHEKQTFPNLKVLPPRARDPVCLAFCEGQKMFDPGSPGNSREILVMVRYEKGGQAIAIPPPRLTVQWSQTTPN
ncbi:unnamed protein product, partial [Pylaiella littoralis]